MPCELSQEAKANRWAGLYDIAPKVQGHQLYHRHMFT